jgi:hypothetical protein
MLSQETYFILGLNLDPFALVVFTAGIFFYLLFNIFYGGDYMENLLYPT